MATIADKSRTKEVIDRLQNIINNASPVPLASGKVMVYKEEMQSLLTELELQLASELKTYHEVNDRRGKIINEAKKEAERIIYQAEHTASRVRVTKRKTRVSPFDYSMLNEEEKSALGNANEIYGASLIYTDEMLTEVTNLISDVYHNIRNDYEIILKSLDERLHTIMSNREELMTGLQEMDLEERSQQILEIGQLLSNELYNTRMQAKMNSDEYEDGSVQLTLDLQEEQEEKTRQAEEEAKRAAQALAEMTAQRDELMKTVEQMKNQGMGNTLRSVRDTENVADETFEEAEEEYEVVYVTEDELEDGQEYEIEYVDEEYTDEEDEEQSSIPLTSHFQESEKIAVVPSEKVSRIAKKIATEEAYQGLIGAAAEDKREKVELKKEEKLENQSIKNEVKEQEKLAEVEKDEDIRTDANGNEYVQATMKFDSEYEITEF